MAPYLLYPGYSGALTDWKAEILNNLIGKATNEFITDHLFRSQPTGVFFTQVKEIRRSSPLASLTPTELRARWS